jgi:hypothetical protein
MISALVNGHFSGNYIPNDSEEFYSINLVDMTSRKFHIQFCDTPGIPIVTNKKLIVR